MPASIAWLLFLAVSLICSTRAVGRASESLARYGQRIASIRARPELLVFMVAALLGGVPTLLGVVPPPSTHDEFAYLLAADTFTNGRLTNPTHPLWPHFETFHQIMQPTYMAKFPPGQGLALAAGTVLGNPVIGAWGTIALACAAIVWLLRACVPVNWAIVGGLFAATHPLLFWWGQIYWGGGVALLGGVILTGAVLRMLRKHDFSYGVIAGIGMAILANSRPFEGALVSFLLMLVVAVNAIQHSRLRPMLVRAVLPIVIVLAPVVGWMMYYNFRVSGDPLTMPYIVHARQYMTSPLLWIGSHPPRPEYRHDKLRQYYDGFEHHEYASQRTIGGFVRGAGEKLATVATHYFDLPTLAMLLLGLPWAMRTGTGIALGVLALFIAAHLLLTPWLRVQYLAPGGGLFFMVLVGSAWWFWQWRPGGLQVGAGIVRAVLILQFVVIVLMIWGMIHNPRPLGIARAQIVHDLNETPGRHLVIVRYSHAPQSIFEWVYNEADIDESKIVWARSIDEKSDRRLRHYFRGRVFWRLDVDGTIYQLNRDL